MNWEDEFLKFYNEKVLPLNGGRFSGHVVFNWIKNNIHLIAREEALNFAAFKEQYPMPKPLYAIWEFYLDNEKLNKENGKEI